MAPRTGDPRPRRTMGALLAAAEEAFADRPPEAVTVEELARNAGVAVTSIYNHFGSKEGLFAEVVDRALNVDREYMDIAYTPGRAPAEQINVAGEQYLRFYLDHPRFFRMLAFPSQPGPYPAAAEISKRLARRVDDQNARLRDALQRGMADGSVRQVDPDRAATVLWAAWNGIISLAWRPDPLRVDEPTLRELIRLAGDVVSNGLATGAMPERRKVHTIPRGRPGDRRQWPARQ
jgi:TetR/AcrR family transcriptional regulator